MNNITRLTRVILEVARPIGKLNVAFWAIHIHRHLTLQFAEDN